MLTAGRLKERIKVERFTETELPSGSVSKTWTTIHEPFCDLQEKSASIDTVATLETLPQVFIFTLRYNPEVSYVKGDRITWRNRVFKIHSFQVDASRTTTVITAKALNETTQMNEN